MPSTEPFTKALNIYDLLFGEDEDSPSGMSAPILDYALRQMNRSGGSSRSVCGMVAEQTNRQQAMTKLISSGGTSNARGLKAQMNYLRKDDTVILELSDMNMGAALDEDNEEAFVNSWGLDDWENTKSSKTSHFVVSFPEGTDHQAAYQAGRDWASELFASGEYGDTFDYYTAFHTDRAHPHMHVVVNRRGMHNGNWLKVSKRSAINYDEMRFVQVRVAADHGIELAATPRHFRGITDEPYSKFEVFKAMQEGREPEAPQGSEFSRSAKALIHKLVVSKAYSEAVIVSDHYQGLAEKMLSVIEHIEAYKTIKSEGPKRGEDSFVITAKELNTLNDLLDEHRSTISENFDQLDSKAISLPTSVEKTTFLRGIATLKAETLPFMPELARSLKPDPDQQYRGIAAYDDFTHEIANEFLDTIRFIARDAGLDQHEFAARFDGTVAMPSTIADQWAEQDLKAITDNLVESDPVVYHEAQQLALARLQSLHEDIAAVYRDARSQLDNYEYDRKQLTRLLKRADTLPPGNVHTALVRVLTEDQINDLDNGEYTVLDGITTNLDDQIKLANLYLDVEISHAQQKAEFNDRVDHLSMIRDQLPHHGDHSPHEPDGNEDDGFHH